MKPNWLPDWLNESQYPDPRKTTPAQWAWEFLRRNREYQRLWHELVGPNYSRPKPSNRQHPGKRTRLRIKPDLEPLLSKFLRKFHIASRPPPSPADSGVTPGFKTEFIQYEVGIHKNQRVYGSLKQGQMVVWIDLTWPIQPQLKNAKAVFDAEYAEQQISTKWVRVRPKNYKDYLRILDGLEHGSSPKKISAIIYPGENRYPEYPATQKIRDDIKAARRLRDHDFWRIAQKH
jgi:Family of unknown function (DUF6499)